jgi:hypothetical protein
LAKERRRREATASTKTTSWIRGGVLDGVARRDDTRRNRVICGAYGSSAFALRDTTVDAPEEERWKSD